MKKIMIIAFLMLSLCGCNKKDNEVDSISSIIEAGNYEIIDVRTKEEYESGHVVGAINIPVDRIDASISLDKSKAILVYCRSGVRSKKAYDILIDLGYDVYDLKGYENIDLPKE